MIGTPATSFSDDKESEPPQVRDTILQSVTAAIEYNKAIDLMSPGRGGVRSKS